MMDPAELGAWMREHFTRSAFRLETLQAYEVATDGSDYRRYLDGEPTWTPERKQPWLDRLAEEKARGLYRHRVRIVTHPITPYTRYECEWGYAPNIAAGEDVRVLDLDEHDRFGPEVLDGGDWWLVTDTEGVLHVARMRYADDGQFLGADDDPTAGVQFQAARDVLWRNAEPFTSWWQRHGELHRRGAHAA